MTEEVGLQPLQNLSAVFFKSLGIQLLQAGQIELQKHLGPSAHFLCMLQIYSAHLVTPSQFLNTASSTHPILAACCHSLSAGYVQLALQHFQATIQSSNPAHKPNTQGADVDTSQLHKGLHPQDCLLFIICELCDCHCCFPVNCSKLP